MLKFCLMLLNGIGVHKYTPKHDFNPMDCTDIIIGSARGMKHRIGDYYTRDRSTPRQDSFWGGRDSLTAAMGFERDGVTTILFRRKLEADNHFSDHDIIDGAMQVQNKTKLSPYIKYYNNLMFHILKPFKFIATFM